MKWAVKSLCVAIVDLLVLEKITTANVHSALFQAMIATDSIWKKW